MRRISSILGLVVAATISAAEPTHDITPADYASVAMITGIAVSPDGKHVAYTVATWETADDTRKTDLWVVATDGKSPPRRLTFDRANDRLPKWSAEGDAIYFLGNRRRASESRAPYDGSTQVWRVQLLPGPALATDPRPVTRVAGGVTSFDIAPGSNELFYVTDHSTTDEDDFSHLRKRYPAEYGHGQRRVSRVYKISLTSWRTEKVVDDNRYIREFTVTRDGQRVAMVSAADDSVIKSEGESRVDIWEGGKITTPPTDVYRKKASSPWAWLESIAWSPDGKRLAFCAIFDAYPAEIILMNRVDNTWNVSRMPRTDGLHVHGYGSHLQWAADDRLLFIGERHGRTFLAAMQGDQVTAKDDDSHFVTLFDQATKSPTVAFIGGGNDRFPDLYAANPDGQAVKLTDINPQASHWKIPTIRHITWKAPDGTQVGGSLELPHGHKAGQKLPLVVAIHGGPTTSTKADLAFDPHNGRLYFSAAGYAVLLPNYRGSTGYGDKFVTDLIGNENDIEVKDILAGIQHLIDEGIADPQRVAVMGWSNGGYLTNCLITLKDSPVKIKAASSGAGILDTVAEWGFNDEPAYPRVFKKGLPWEQPDVYRKTSPTYGLGNVTTPTLIHVGANDVRCPPGHSRMLYRALKEYVDVPTELVVYPGEPHGLSKLSHRRAKMEWDLAWFAKYLRGRSQHPSSDRSKSGN